MSQRELNSNVWSLFSVFFLLVTLLTLSGCNTIEGIGEDVEGAGERIEDAANG
ncbi:MAG: entericidin A/B family lipoprotein [Immundisolibacteraceae bacterium]|nr:entericidin A/B family lipoprotein [Immundisolibacteraceae bacterium]